MNNEEKFLPLGSIILIKGSVRKMIIVGRALMQKIDNQTKYFDYACCTYPEGLIGDQAIYVNHADIDEVVYKGYADDDDERMQKYIKEQLDKMAVNSKL